MDSPRLHAHHPLNRTDGKPFGFVAIYSVTVRDKDGGVGTATKQVTVTVPTGPLVTLATDPTDPTKTALFVYGTNAGDVIVINPSDSQASGVQVTINGGFERKVSPLHKIHETLKRDSPEF